MWRWEQAAWTHIPSGWTKARKKFIYAKIAPLFLFYEGETMKGLKMMGPKCSMDGASFDELYLGVVIVKTVYY